MTGGLEGGGKKREERRRLAPATSIHTLRAVAYQLWHPTAIVCGALFKFLITPLYSPLGLSRAQQRALVTGVLTEFTPTMCSVFIWKDVRCPQACSLLRSSLICLVPAGDDGHSVFQDRGPHETFQNHPQPFPVLKTCIQ